MKKQREEYLKKVTIGEVENINNNITLESYNPNWPKLFKKLKQTILKVLPDATVEHVGSTSIPSLTAKPIIDIILLVKDSDDEASYLPQLESIDYYLRIREPDWYQHRLFKHHQYAVNLHVFSFGCLEAKRMLDFRDILRNDPNAFKLYADTKKKLASQKWKYVQEYADAKTEVIKMILNLKQHP